MPFAYFTDRQHKHGNTLDHLAAANQAAGADPTTLALDLFYFNRIRLRKAHTRLYPFTLGLLDLLRPSREAIEYSKVNDTMSSD